MKKFSNRIGGLLLCLIFGGSAFVVCGQANKRFLIFDGRPKNELLTAVTKAEEELIEKEVKKKESVIKEKSSLECDEDAFSVIGAASGSFTKAKSSQIAYLYELCRGARSFGIGGVVIVEDGKIVSHNTYGDNGLNTGIASLPDINRNGLSEIVLIGAGTGQGYTSEAIEIVELTAGGVKSFGFADTYSDDYGTGKNKTSATAYTITAQTGKTPVYFRETYSQKTAEAKWTLTRKAQKFSLRKDASKYNKIF